MDWNIELAIERSIVDIYVGFIPRLKARVFFLLFITGMIDNRIGI